MGQPYYHKPATDTAAVVNIADPGGAHQQVISGIYWSYSGGTPTGGNLKIESPVGTTLFYMDITAAGAGFVPFPCGFDGNVSDAVRVTLAAGGTGIQGSVNVLVDD